MRSFGFPVLIAEDENMVGMLGGMRLADVQEYLLSDVTSQL